MMKASQLMTREVVHCFPRTTLHEASMLMADHHCGALPVLDESGKNHVIGIITDRDIVCRGIANGIDPVVGRVDSCMSSPVIAVTEDEDIEACSKVLRQQQIRRVPVIDDQGRCSGIVSQVDILRGSPANGTPRQAARRSKAH
jgi:CBS domain-containing protein